MNITHYRGPYSPLHAYFADESETTCVISETINCDIRPHLLLGQHGHLMCLSPARVRELIPPLIHFAAHGRLPHRTAPTSADYEI